MPTPALEIVTRPSVCPLDCPDTCSVLIDLQGDRVVGLRGDPQHPITQGFACVKMARYPERQHHPDRLLQPQRRAGPKGSGQFEPITWDEALELIAAGIDRNRRRYGDTSLLPYCYAGNMGLIQRDYPLAFFRALGASELDQTICATTASTAWEMNYGPGKLSVPPEAVAQSQLIILWGVNLLRSQSHLVPWLKQARQQGARIVHIDPYHNETSRFADQHISINVGTDAALALAIGGEILRRGLEDRDYLERCAAGVDQYAAACHEWTAERAEAVCGVPADSIRGLAIAMANQPRTFLKVGYGLSRNEGGGNAVRAITLLPALTGAWQHVGGGAGLSCSGAFQLNQSRFSGQHLLRPDRPHVNQNQLAGRAAPAPGQWRSTIATLVVFNSTGGVRPIAQRAGRSGATICSPWCWNCSPPIPPTMRTFVARHDVHRTRGHLRLVRPLLLQWAEPVMPPPPHCRPNSWVFQQRRRLVWTIPSLA